MRFHVLIGEVVIGETNLDFGDPPMGVAYGPMHPRKGLAKFASTADADGYLRPDAPMRICTKAGHDLESQGGVYIQAPPQEHSGEPYEVSILGICADDYQRLFPEHVEAYEQLEHKKRHET